MAANRPGCRSVFTGSPTGSGFEKSLMKGPGPYWDKYGDEWPILCAEGTDFPREPAQIGSVCRRGAPAVAGGSGVPGILELQVINLV